VSYDQGEVATFAGYLPEIEKLWHTGLPPGDKTGWPSLDKFYSVAEGQLTVVTGWPGSGKSEFLDALLVNLMHQGWHTCYFSPENQPVELHMAKILEKVSGMPFGRGPTERMTVEDIRSLAISMLASRYQFLPIPEEGTLTAPEVLDRSEPWLMNWRGKGRKVSLVIDPWNELEHNRPHQMSETEYVSKTLTKVRNWARPRGIHVFIVAHPQKMRRENGKLPIPTLDMISGSQHWWNKADCGITVWRNHDELESQEVEIHVPKIRFKHIGRPGVVKLRYDRVTGRYHEIPALQDVSAYRRAARGEDD
jgi:twinkle protein